MDLDDITAVVRPRNHWEAVDLGCLMARSWWKPLYLGWFAITTPVFLGVYVVLHGHPLLAMFIIWWLKPAYERYPLLIVSQALFGRVPRTRDALGEYFRVLGVQLIQSLTIRRLVPTRSFDQPVTQLENLSGSERSRRLELMRRTAGSPAFWLTFVGVHVEMFLTLGFLMLAYQLLPREVEVDWWGLMVSADAGALDWLSNLFYFLAIGLMGPVYAAGGFSLYVNRRIELEGWDIELGFKRLMNRVSRGTINVACVLVCLTIACAVPGAGASQQIDLDTNGSKRLIEEVMDGPEFHEESVTEVPEALRDWFETEEEDPSEQPSRSPWVLALVQTIAQWIEFLLWVVIISGIIWIAYRYRGWIAQILDREPAPFVRAGERPRVMFGLDVSASTLPADPIGAAESLWSQGRSREAVSLLYRAALVALMDRHECRFSQSDTEGQCVAKAERHAPADAAHRFRRLTASWQGVAYAHRVPSDSSFAELCRTWALQLGAKT